MPGAPTVGVLVLIIFPSSSGSVDPAGAGPAGPAAVVRWLGHACFLIDWSDGAGGRLRVITDPYPADMGLPPIRETVDVVTVSHEHFDHNAAGELAGKPRVIRGQAGKEAVAVDETVGGVRIVSIPTWHDPNGGKQRGPSAMFAFELGGMRLVHAGDLGEELDRTQLRLLGRPDAFFVPVGGHFTIDAAQARALVEAVRPRVVIPMHYKTSSLPDWPIADPDKFLDGWERVRHPEGGAFRLVPGRLPEPIEVWSFGKR